ncbi:MAG TPA: GGDEF domain-containing protein [Usitatibacter sp.]|nr:GGDEF domain-containing protein [Usitatibacter sp.]
MSPLPSAGRLAAIGLGIAAFTILGLAFLVVSDLTREADLHREVIAVQQEQDSLEALRVRLNQVVASARLAAATGDEATFRAIEHESAAIDGRLDSLRASDDASMASIDVLVDQARLLLVHARSVAPAYAKGPAAATAAVQETEKVASTASASLERSLEDLTRRVNDRSVARIRVGESLRRYVAWFVAGSVAALVGLFLAFRGVQRRERAALRRIEWLAHFDSVTGLPNRALLADRLSQETARARRASGSFAILLFDLDGFKDVNDTWGHAAGDRVLALVAERARTGVRASDTVGRLGGDEFLAILPETAHAGALAVAEKVRASLSEPYALESAIARVGASVGVALFPDHGEEVDSLLSAADGALYEAKREGKGRVQIARSSAQRTRPGTAREAASG